MRSNLGQFSQIIASKDFLLMKASSGRSFYLSDNPVCLHNSEPRHPLLGNLGLDVRGIEIYLPISSELMLGAFCPSILEALRKVAVEQETSAQKAALAAVTQGLITPDQMKAYIENMREIMIPARTMIDAQAQGTALQLESTNMDFSNSLQMAYARDFVVCAKGDFKLARQVMDTVPNARGSVLSMN